MALPEQALRKDRDRVLEFDAQEQFALGTQDDENERETLWVTVIAKSLTAVFVGFGLVVLADWAFYEGQHVQMVVDLFLPGAALGNGV
jgi:hypothetical protein